MKLERMQAVALDLVTLPTTKDVIEKNRLSPNTLTRLYRDPNFQRMMVEIRTRVFEEAIDRATCEARAAVDRLIELSKDKKMPASARVNALKTIIDLSGRYYDQKTVREQLDAVTEMVYQLETRLKESTESDRW